MKFSNYILPYADFYFQRSFNIKVTFWASILVEKKIILCKK